MNWLLQGLSRHKAHPSRGVCLGPVKPLLSNGGGGLQALPTYTPPKQRPVASAQLTSPTVGRPFWPGVIRCGPPDSRPDPRGWGAHYGHPAPNRIGSTALLEAGAILRDTNMPCPGPHIPPRPPYLCNGIYEYLSSRLHIIKNRYQYSAAGQQLPRHSIAAAEPNPIRD